MPKRVTSKPDQSRRNFLQKAVVGAGATRSLFMDVYAAMAKARIGLAENGGGYIGRDAAAMVISVLEH